MYLQEKQRLWIGVNEKREQICMVPKMCNRHRLIAGATGTGKTVTLKVMAESFYQITFQALSSIIGILVTLPKK